MSTPTAPEVCAACHKPLAADDRFCARCGTPTPRNADPGVTLVHPVGIKDSPDSAPTEPSNREIGGAAPEGNFTERLRQVLSAEYSLIAVTGQGGMARVYRAHDRRLNRNVAIKVIKPDLLGTQELVERFRAEGIALAKLRHPGIVPIYDIRERDGVIYYIMPFVQGTTLEARLDRSRLPPFESRRILSELADALGAAHRAKMIHLDIKPANVFLEGDMAKVLLMDFGIAKALTDQVQDSDDELIIGTPEYMSPEQAKGSAEIDHRSDIYSMGVLGYRMLAGRPPFRGATATDIIARHVSEAPVPIREVNPTIPKEFADTIMRCLEKDPWKRFSSAMELRAALDAVTFFTKGGDAAAARPHTVSPTLIAALGLLVGVLIGMALQ